MGKLQWIGLLLLAGCQPAEKQLSPTQQAVTAWMRENQNDPASYAPGKWGAENLWLQQDADRQRAELIGEQAQEAIAARDEASGRLLRIMRAGGTKADAAPFQAEYDKAASTARLLRAREDSLRGSGNTTPLGVTFFHTFRHKNKAGAIVLDSARFVVEKDGRVWLL